MPVGSERSIEIGDAGDTRRRINKSGRRQIHLLYRYFCLQGSESGVRSVDRPGITLQLQRATGGRISPAPQRKRTAAPTRTSRGALHFVTSENPCTVSRHDTTAS